MNTVRYKHCNHFIENECICSVEDAHESFVSRAVRKTIYLSGRFKTDIVVYVLSLRFLYTFYTLTFLLSVSIDAVNTNITSQQFAANTYYHWTEK